jgi:hypothetical protein
VTVAAGLLEEQLAHLQEAYPAATAAGVNGGTTLVTVPGIVLPAGWNQAVTTVKYIAPVGYPMARPDCFWAEPALRLASGGMPQSAGVNQIPGTSDTGLWFSWHLAAWNPAADSLLTYVRVIQRRLADAR